MSALSKEDRDALARGFADVKVNREKLAQLGERVLEILATYRRRAEHYGTSSVYVDSNTLALVDSAARSLGLLGEKEERRG